MHETNQEKDKKDDEFIVDSGSEGYLYNWKLKTLVRSTSKTQRNKFKTVLNLISKLLNKSNLIICFK